MTYDEVVRMANIAIDIQNKKLAKIRAEIDRQEKWLMDAGYTAYNVDIAFSAIKSAVAEGSENSENN
jgi:tRNA A37 threonylcarbamoyltransferase TsaD